MILHLNLNGDGAWPDIADKKDKLTWINDGELSISCLPKGMTSGAPSVAIRIDLPDGRIIVAETSMRMFQIAAVAMRARYGDQTQ